MSWTAAKLAKATGGELIQGMPESVVGGISTDTRNIRPGFCFVALPGERRDGHEFIPAALAEGALALIVSREIGSLPPSAPPGLVVIRVRDTLFALGELARSHRKLFSFPVIGITGSNGKTGTKEILAEILGVKRNVLKNRGNFNNLIGVPLTLLELDPKHEAAIVEMGINVPGEMARLAEIAAPTAGLITNIYPAHLEGLGSLDGILNEKGRLWTSLGKEGLAAVNMDDPRLLAFSKKIEARSVTYSRSDPSARVRVGGEIEIRDGGSCFRLILDGETVPVTLPLLGDHQVQNALAAAAVSRGLGETAETIALGLARCRPAPQRLCIHQLADGRMLVDDTYNANPGSVLAAVRTVLAAGSGKPFVAVLGEMRELGPEGASLHYSLGRCIGALPVSHLVTLGDLAAEILRGAKDAGLPSTACRHAATHEEIVSWIRGNAPKNAWILVKGSRGMTMERIVEGILER